MEKHSVIKSGKGGSNTRTGLVFEGKTDLATFLNSKTGYQVKKDKVYFENELVARVFKKYSFYNLFLTELKIDWTKLLSKRLFPDDCIFVLMKNTLFIIECKFQQVEGSVDEKLQTCDFKKKQYQKLLSQANIDVEYVYLLSDWFRNAKYQDVLYYIHSVHCHYYFEYIPLTKLGLPVPQKDRGKWVTHDSKYRGNFSPYIAKNIILRYSQENDLVLDYFVGGGTTLIECKLNNRRAIGIDINPKAVELTTSKLEFVSPYNPEIKVYNGDSTCFAIDDDSVDLICTHHLMLILFIIVKILTAICHYCHIRNF
jgi:hypothetical protein